MFRLDGLCVEGCDRKKAGAGLIRAGPPPGGPVRSVRKEQTFFPGSGPTDLRYGKDGLRSLVSRARAGVVKLSESGGLPAMMEDDT